ncbi:hypothetical protein PHISCL_03797 [Aspergillus sclerotialis]|uniref:Putative lipase ATG15 n=1 Tax=Aspergillus sclerotialis TaxID=2070753 RepID=A0A3A3A168_9EURO|nr:hypothetical protein PHISCL_03797 [Aspergillus sclerotialis]
MTSNQRRSKKRPLCLQNIFKFVFSLTLLSNPGYAHEPLYYDSRDGESPIIRPQIPLNEPPSFTKTHEFNLRHIFHRGTYDHPNLHKRLDIKPHTRLWAISEDGLDKELVTFNDTLTASSNPVTIQRLADRRLSVIEGHLSAARAGSAVALSPSEWVMDTLPGPNVTDKDSVLTFAKMTANDYIEEPGTEDWQDVHGPLNYSSSFGWKGDGLRGHIYADKSNSTIVISLKGTSPALFDGAGTTTNDKLNDNLYFSCCCGQGGSYLWRQVCDCQKSAFTANLTCITEAMNDENRYYRASIDLYSNVTKLYPNANVWLTGHSLGGAMSSLLGLTFGLPVVTFEAVPEALPAARLGFQVLLGKIPDCHNRASTLEPIILATQPILYTWELVMASAQCVLGMCTYDTVEDKGWRVAIGTHRIKSVISDVIEEYDSLPTCEREEECFDCQLWKFFRSNGSEITTTTTTTTTTSTSTSTSTCKTPGWWGCLDETTTTTSTSSATGTSTSTCKTPGWFGCNDPTTTTTTTSTPALTSAIPTLTTATSTCKNPGRFGCLDPISSTTPTSCSVPLTTTSTCETPGIFWGCWDTPTESGHPITSPTTSASTCHDPGFFWGCWGGSTTSNPHQITPAPTPSPSHTSSTDPYTCTRSIFFGLICLDP